jgi:hypothetical protein
VIERAPGGPGIPPTWTSSAKDMVCEPAPKLDPACYAYNFLILLMKMVVVGVPIGADQDPTRKVNL